MTIDQMKEKARERLKEALWERHWRRLEYENIGPNDGDSREFRFEKYLRAYIRTVALMDAYAELDLVTYEESNAMRYRTLEKANKAYAKKED